jgi:cyclophilin family peptidyl-prolyl cis-trans isomerase
MKMIQRFSCSSWGFTATGTDGESIWSFVTNDFSSNNPPLCYFLPEILPILEHIHKGTVSTAVVPALENHKGSQFFITLSITWMASMLCSDMWLRV